MLRTNSTRNQDKTLVPPYYFTGTNVYELYYTYSVRQDEVPNLVILPITRAREPELTPSSIRGHRLIINRLYHSYQRCLYPSLSSLCRHWRHPSEFCYGPEADLRRSAPPYTRPSSRHWCGDKSRRQLPPGTCAGTRQGATADVGPLQEQPVHRRG